MNPNYTVLIVLLIVPLIVFAVWKGSSHVSQALAHSFQLRRHEQEIRKLEEDTAAQQPSQVGPDGSNGQ
ncbi:hypothetical protein LOZ12_005577 [Ophidiomyces ophidiicola]|nr:hypothetical protein LOZ62_003619 [Ophidiomyces ophidiicola]KAI2001508.1 hypothetical protein LOZ50_005620 [Ophidiomyces ophidiicola]KAI2023327.1 hypothetical protein LOZ45_004019 [Ophidiomyces ophidiicola]KAI2046240.1 hypothetical protein LOZ38_005454 [Ophidiomyces ophidiicola]KAI2069705.1 hypothetical protein LOZ37_005230 [Ophidiomyces ophidiicola]